MTDLIEPTIFCETPNGLVPVYPPGEQMLRDVHEEFSSRLPGCVIAGGAVRDTLLNRTPKDYDVFVLDNADLPVDWAKGLELVTAPEWHKSEPNLQATVKWQGVYVQVMQSEEKTLRALVDTFDWNVSLFGFDGTNFLQLTNLKDIAPNKPLRLNKVTYPVSTLRRGFRFSERLGMKFESGELAKLCVLAAGRLLP